MTDPSVAVVVCAYTLDRWDDLVQALQSAAAQDPAPDELWLVVDHNDLLLQRAQHDLPGRLPGLRVVPNSRTRGLSGARNTALEQVGTDVVVFLDDDAAAESGWLRRLAAPYADPAVVAVGGSATPRWPEGADRPGTLPAADGQWGELDWVVGCSYRGLPEEPRAVRNLMGCNMSLRRSVVEADGGFNEGLGRVGRTPLGCEETELCIRATAARPAAVIWFDPAARVRHRVSPDRLTWRYLLRRCYAEGVSKAAVALLVGADRGLATERSYATRVLPSAVARGLARAATRPGARVRSLEGALAVTVGLTATAWGYARGRLLAARAGGLTVTPAPRLRLTPATGGRA